MSVQETVPEDEEFTPEEVAKMDTARDRLNAWLERADSILNAPSQVPPGYRWTETPATVNNDGWTDPSEPLIPHP